MKLNNINEEMALRCVLSFISVKDLLINAMNGYANQVDNGTHNDANTKDNIDTIYKAIETFL